MMTHKEALQKAWERYFDFSSTEHDEFGGIEAAIRAYINARGFGMLPYALTEKMYDVMHEYAQDAPEAWDAIIAAAPDPFKDA